MSAVVFSIKPQFVDLIFTGVKRYEYRKRALKRDNITKIIIYATKPVGKVVGEARIKQVLIDNPANLWSLTSIYAGIDKSYFNSYFNNCNIAVAYELCDTILYDTQRELSEYGLFYAPQSFGYI